MLRIVIIEDDSSVRSFMKETILSFCEDVVISSNAVNMKEGVKAVRKHKPDLIFLDIVLPDGNGIDLLNMILPLKPYVVFITAYERFTYEAIKYNPEDFLVKPIIPIDLIRIIKKTKTKKREEKHYQQFEKISEDKIVISTAENIHLLSKEKIIRCEFCKNYTTFIMDNKKRIISSYPLKYFEKQINYPPFLKVHQSHVVNTSYIDYFDKKNMMVKLTDNTKIPVSIRKKGNLISFFKKVGDNNNIKNL